MSAAGLGGARIEAVSLRPVAAIARGPVGSASARHARREGLVVVLRDADGRAGLGEASPLPGVSPDDLAEVRGALERAALAAPGPLGEAEEGPAIAWAAELARRWLGEGAPAARFAIETALLDLEAQRRGVPLARLLAPRAEEAVEVSALLVDLHARSAIDEARARVAEGALTFKVKIGARPVADDVAAIGALRDALGPGVRLFADANGAYAPAEARAALLALAAVGVRFVEQPVAPEALGDLGPAALPVWADESLARPAPRRAALASEHVAGIVLKPTVLGLADALALGEDARRRGKEIAVTHTFEGPIGFRACAALALALAPVAPRAGLWPHAALDDAGLPVRGGRLSPWAGAGLGLDAARREALEGAPAGGAR